MPDPLLAVRLLDRFEKKWVKGMNRYPFVIYTDQPFEAKIFSSADEANMFAGTLPSAVRERLDVESFEPDTRRIIAMVPGYWGKGATVDEAKNNARKAGARGRLTGQWLVKQLPEVAVDACVDSAGAIYWQWAPGVDPETLDYEQMKVVVLERPTR